MKENAPDYVKDRRAMMIEREKIIFFSALHRLPHSDENRKEMLLLPDNVKSTFQHYDTQHDTETDNQKKYS